ncbi:unnamed protein product [Sphenostylis stenocarpa]|uniref:ACT domain-containing protein ACR n=1 Tax=Sphenostylis stenocarpa TaxID=92480 RepID=A0AA86S9J1_9FABA|nr:unnamed protein product [Sphenostylis stenocarpa]
MRSVGVTQTQTIEHTAIKLLGSDRSELLSEVNAVLTNLKCNIVNAVVWTHNTSASVVMHLTDEEIGSAITDPQSLSLIKELLCNVMGGGNKVRGSSNVVTKEVNNTERRLHQMMFADRDYEQVDDDDEDVDEKSRPKVTVINWSDNDYSVIIIQCKDKTKLLFDVVFTLTEMQYMVFHASIDSKGSNAYQEFYIKHIDRSPIESDAERQRVIQCLEAAIKRRLSENNLTVTRAEVTTKGAKAVNTFYVGGSSGCPVESKTVESIRQAIGNTILKVKGKPEELKPTPQDSPTKFLFGGLYSLIRFFFGGIFKSRSLANFGLVKDTTHINDGNVSHNKEEEVSQPHNPEEDGGDPQIIEDGGGGQSTTDPEEDGGDLPIIEEDINVIETTGSRVARELSGLHYLLLPLKEDGIRQRDLVIGLKGKETSTSGNPVNAVVSTHNTRAVAVMHVTDEETGSAITDPQRLSLIKEFLCNVMGGGNKVKGSSNVVTKEVNNTERRLH